jgi:hypothetical protein
MERGEKIKSRKYNPTTNLHNKSQEKYQRIKNRILDLRPT